MRKHGGHQVAEIPTGEVRNGMILLRAVRSVNSPWFAKDAVRRRKKAKLARKANVKRLRQQKR